MRRPVIERVVDANAVLGECPRWSETEACLYWLDIDGRRVHRFDPASGRDEATSTPGRPGALVLTSVPGRLLVAAEHRLAWMDWRTGAFEPWVDLEAPGTGNRLNDGRCDTAGRLWVGSMFAPPEDTIRSGLLHRVEGDGASTVMERDIGVSNGLAFTPDGATMYFADSARRLVWAYDYDPVGGIPSRQRPFFDFGLLPGKPDGACIDADGCYWVACVYGGALLRISPDGRLDRRVELPVARPTMCAFGTEALDVMFVTSIGAGGRAAHDEPDMAGSLLAFAPGVAGVPEPRFVAGA